MTDGHTISKLWHFGYSASLPISDRNNEYLQLKKYYLKSQPNIKHNCSKSNRKSNDENDWLVFLLSFGLKQTLSDLNQFTDLKNGNHLLTLAKLDDNMKPFSFPKSVAVMKNGIIIVADTGNNRLIAFNSGGIQTFVFEKYNIKDEEFHLKSPLSVCVLANVFIAVANYDNMVINVLSHHGTNKLIFVCQSKPICLSSDLSNILYVLTDSQTIECYSKLGNRFKTIQLLNKNERFFTIMKANNNIDEIYLSESNSNEIVVINKNGLVLRNLKLYIPGTGMNVFLSGICYANNKILVADSINRCVSIFDCSTGKFEEMVINGKSELGCIQDLTLSLDNHLITTEFSLNQDHCVKIFSTNLKLNLSVNYLF